jgi:hypothetical protein
MIAFFHQQGPHRAKTDDTTQIHVPIALRRRGLETKLIINAPGKDQSSRKPDPVLFKLIANAHRWWEELMTGRYLTTRALAKAYGKNERYVARVLQLAFWHRPSFMRLRQGSSRLN